MRYAWMAFALIGLGACKKEPGEGGNSSIRGKVTKEVRIVLTNPDTYQYELPAADVDVYIVFGDHISPDERVYTNYDGEYEILNLREGKYTVYVYSRDTTGTTSVEDDRMVVLEEVEITDKKQTVEVPELRIYDIP